MAAHETLPDRTGPDLDSLGDEDLATHICSFATRIAAATCLFLLAIAEYDRRRAWAAWECRSMPDWLAWHCGISRITAAQYCRTATALTTLPLTRKRFAAGELSYSQVRALTKVATPTNETVLVDLARAMTANQLEKVTATYQHCRAAAETTATSRDRRRTLTWSHDDDGNVTGIFRLPPEQAAILTTAIDTLTTPHNSPATYDIDDRDLDPVGARRADALIELATTHLDHHTHDPGDRYLVTIITDATILQPEPTQQPDTHTGIHDTGIHDTGIHDTGIHDTGIVEAEIIDERPGPSSAYPNAPDPTNHTPIETGRVDDRPLGRCHLADGPSLAPSTIRRLLCDQPHLAITTHPTTGTVLDIGRRTRRITRAIQRALNHRDQGCRYPGCTNTRTQAHHIHHWIDGGHTRLDNLISLCPRHHHLHHQGRYTIHPQPDGTTTFKLPNGQHLTNTPPPPIPPTSPLHPPTIPRACTPNWDGTTLTPRTLNDIIHALLQTDYHLLPTPQQRPTQLEPHRDNSHDPGDVDGTSDDG